MRSVDISSPYKKNGPGQILAVTKSVAKGLTVVVFLVAMLTVLYFAA